MKKTSFNLSILTIAILSAFVSTSRAETVLVFGNDRDSATNKLEFLTDDQKMITGGIYTSGSEDSAGPKKFKLSQLLSNEGVVLETYQGVKAITLRGQIDLTKGTGKITFKFMANGLTSQYKECSTGLLRSTTGTWSLINQKNKKTISKAKLITWTFGIESIQGVCD